jgi:mycothiol synthase
VTLPHRPLEPADAAEVAALVSAHDAFHAGETDGASADDVLDWWLRCAENGRIGVLDEHGAVIGVGVLRSRGNDYYLADSFVHPDHRGKGAGSFLLEWAERRSVEDGMSAVRAAVSATDDAGRHLIEGRGYRYIRSFYRMVVDLDGPPAPPAWPDGYRVARLAPGEERDLYDVLEGAFADHWGYEPRAFAEWSGHFPGLLERLCYLVRDREGTPAAGAVCDEERFGTGYVGVLGVLRAFRRLGLGEALLRQAFCDLYAIGRRRISLGVDAENTTGATRLYERVGMVVSSRDDAYEKLL